MEQDYLKERILSRHEAQELLSLATLPSLTEQGCLEARGIVMEERFFVLLEFDPTAIPDYVTLAPSQYFKHRS